MTLSKSTCIGRMGHGMILRTAEFSKIRDLGASGFVSKRGRLISVFVEFELRGTFPRVETCPAVLHLIQAYQKH